MSELPERLPALEVEHISVQTDDGVSLAVQIAGPGRGHSAAAPPYADDGPGAHPLSGRTPWHDHTVLLANGIGVVRPGLDHLAAHLAEGHTVVTWDYRGAGRSRMDPHRHAVDIVRHARDALAILDQLGISRAVVLGWSMGVPVEIELAFMAPDRVAGLGALFGAAGKPFHHAFGRALGDLLAATLAHAHHAAIPAQLLLDAAVALPPVTWLVLSKTGFVGGGAHREVFRRNVASVANNDLRTYFRTLHALATHDAHDRLGAIRCPVLVVAGGKDLLTPPRSAEQMAAALPAARLLVLPDASHFGVIEYGPTLWTAIDALISESFESPLAEGLPNQ